MLRIGNIPRNFGELVFLSFSICFRCIYFYPWSAYRPSSSWIVSLSFSIISPSPILSIPVHWHVQVHLILSTWAALPSPGISIKENQPTFGGNLCLFPVVVFWSSPRSKSLLTFSPMWPLTRDGRDGPFPVSDSDRNASFFLTSPVDLHPGLQSVFSRRDPQLLQVLRPLVTGAPVPVPGLSAYPHAPLLRLIHPPPPPLTSSRPFPLAKPLGA